MWVWLWIGILAGMIMLGATIVLISDALAARRRFDASLARYEPRHAASIPREDPWAAILRPPEPAPAADTGTLERLTETGELRAITDAWIAEHTTQEGIP